MAHETHTKTLPADLSAPAFVDGWRSRALVVGVIFSVIAAGLAFLDGSIDHVLRAWVLGTTLTFGWTVGGLALLMVQYCSGGKWGLLLRRPLRFHHDCYRSIADAVRKRFPALEAVVQRIGKGPAVGHVHAVFPRCRVCGAAPERRRSAPTAPCLRRA